MFSLIAHRGSPPCLELIVSSYNEDHHSLIWTFPSHMSSSLTVKTCDNIRLTAAMTSLIVLKLLFSSVVPFWGLGFLNLDLTYIIAFTLSVFLVGV